MKLKDQINDSEISPEKIVDITTLVSQSPKLITGSLTDNILLNPPLIPLTRREDYILYVFVLALEPLHIIVHQVIKLLQQSE